MHVVVVDSLGVIQIVFKKYLTNIDGNLYNLLKSGRISISQTICNDPSRRIDCNTFSRGILRSPQECEPFDGFTLKSPVLQEKDRG